jgi:hypothetical protein
MQNDATAMDCLIPMGVGVTSENVVEKYSMVCNARSKLDAFAM